MMKINFNLPEDVLEILLKDFTTGNNILWGTPQYECPQESEIKLEQISSGDVIKPRVLKSECDQKKRTNDKAEVYTPLEIIRKMNDMVDDAASYSDEEYICRKVLEVTCGEAPYLVSRYDVSSGDMIPFDKREGLLDRKMRIVNKSEDKDKWFSAAETAVKSTYGYEWQGDSLLLARQNILLDVIEWYEDRFNEEMEISEILKFADIIIHNIVQMDGLTMCIPYSDIPVKIMDWDKGEAERFDGKPEELSLW